MSDDRRWWGVGPNAQLSIYPARTSDHPPTAPHSPPHSDWTDRPHGHVALSHQTDAVRSTTTRCIQQDGSPSYRRAWRIANSSTDHPMNIIPLPSLSLSLSLSACLSQTFLSPLVRSRVPRSRRVARCFVTSPARIIKRLFINNDHIQRATARCL